MIISFLNILLLIVLLKLIINLVAILIPVWAVVATALLVASWMKDKTK